jgi:hypothetical protein
VRKGNNWPDGFDQSDSGALAPLQMTVAGASATLGDHGFTFQIDPLPA